MSTLYGERGRDELLAAGHGLLGDPAAVFGLDGDTFAEPPDWLAAPAAIRRRVAAKPAEDGVAATHWPGVAELARRCAAVAADRSDGGAAPAVAVHRALTLSTALARRLPHPPVPLHDVIELPPPPSELLAERRATGIALSTVDDPGLAAGLADWLESELGGRGSYYLLGHWQDRLRQHACRLAETIDDRWWTDPDALAGLVDDARRLLAAYLATMLKLDPWPPPAPREPRRPVGYLPRQRTQPGPRGRHIVRHPGQ